MNRTKSGQSIAPDGQPVTSSRPGMWTVADSARIPKPGLTVPERLRFLPDGRLVYLLQEESDSGGTRPQLWAMDPVTGNRTCLYRPDMAPSLSGTEPVGEGDGQAHLDAELRSQRTRTPLGGVREFATGGDLLAIVDSGGILVQSLKDPMGRLERVPQSAGAMDVSVTRDGQHLAFVRGGDLYRWDRDAGNEPLRLTPEHAPWVTYGSAEYIAQEELGRERGYALSPDGRWVALTRVDTGHIPVYPIAHEAAGPGLWIEEQRYPFPGAENARVELWVQPFLPHDDGGNVPAAQPRALDPTEYLARFGWTTCGKLLVVSLNREQTCMRFVLQDPLGSERDRVLRQEESDTWLNLPAPRDTVLLRDGSLLTTSETETPSGYRHLLRVGHDGGTTSLTTGDWEVTQVLGVFEDPVPATAAASGTSQATDGFVAFIGTAESPLERHVYRVPLSGGRIQRLTEEKGVHSAVVSADGCLFVDQFSSRTHAPVTVLRSVETGAVLHEVHGNRHATAQSLHLRPPQLVQLSGAEGTPLYGAVYEAATRPTAPETAGTPAVVSVYGGPHAQRVLDDWSLTVDLEAQILAAHGALVFKLDNRGSAHRGHAFEAPLYQKFGEVELADQEEGVRYLTREWQVDPARVGIFGWSYGGYMTLRALTRAPEVFSVGVAGAPVTDFRWYDTAYTERYLQTPKTNPEGYDSTAVFGDLHRLKAPLLIIHGLADENVHFQHTARLLSALTRMGKSFEVLPLPENRHMLRDFDHRLLRSSRTLDFLLTHLGLPRLPATDPKPTETADP